MKNIYKTALKTILVCSVGVAYNIIITSNIQSGSYVLLPFNSAVFLLLALFVDKAI